MEIIKGGYNMQPVMEEEKKEEMIYDLYDRLKLTSDKHKIKHILHEIIKLKS